MQQNRGNNGNIYDLRQNLPHPPAPSQESGSSSGGAKDSGYGFNGEPLSFTPDRTANGTVRRTRTDNSIEFPTQPRTIRRDDEPQRTRNQSQKNGSAQRTRTTQTARGTSGTAQRPKSAQKRKAQNSKNGKKVQGTAQQRYQNQRLRPTQQNRDPVRREKRKKRKMTRAAIKRRRMFRKLMALVTLLAVIAAGVYLTMTMLFKIGTIEVQTEDGAVVQEVGGYTSDQILQALGVQLEENIFSFDPAAKQEALEKQFPLLDSIKVVRDYPNTVVVKVAEAVPAYAMQTKSGWLILSAQFKILACEAAQPEALKTLYGGEPVSTTPGDQLSFEVEQTAESSTSDASGASSEAAEPQEDGRLAALTELQTKLEQYGMLDDVTRIEFADTDQMAFLYQDRISVLLGTLNDLDYKLDRARYVLTDTDGKGVSPTDTGGLDFSHVSAASTTRKFYLAQGEPTLPSGYIVPEKIEPEAPEETADSEQTADGAAADAAAEAAQDETPLTDPARMTATDEENPM